MIRMQNNPYKKFLIEKARTDFFQFAEGRMLLVLKPLHHKLREFIPVRNQLFTKGMIFRNFPVPILREAAVGSRWKTFADYLLSTDVPNMYLFGDPLPQQCFTAMRLIQKKPFLVLLGGVIEHRMMTVDQLQQYASLGDLPTTQAQLLGCLQQPGQLALSTLSRPQTDLALSLKQLCSTEASTP